MKYFLIVVLFTFCSTGFAQVKSIKANYKKAVKTQEQTGISFIQAQMNLVDDLNSIEQIILIRHGEPKIKRNGWATRVEAEQFFIAYDTVGVYPFSTHPVKLYANDVDRIYTSNLNRAKHTAYLSFGDSLQYLADAQFREFERKVLRLPNIKLPLAFWKGSSRIFWILGFNNKNIESFKEAKARTRLGSEKLIKHAEQEKKLVLVAHGFLNRYLKKYLKKQGWKVVHNGGKDYLSASLLVKWHE